MKKLEQVIPLSRVWALDEAFAATAEAFLAGLDLADAIRGQAEYEASQSRLDAQARSARAASGEPEPKPYAMIGSTAIIAVTDLMTKKPTSASRWFGGTSTIQVRRLLQLAQRDADVSQILMTWETPGGEVSGLSEMADQMRETNAVKPIVSFIDDYCASAGVFGCVNSSKVYMNRMGMMGSISTIATVTESSTAAAMKGLKVHVFKTGAYKGAGIPGTVVEPHQAAEFQKMVDHYYQDFKNTVASGRGMTDEQIGAIADGRMFTAQEALDLGLIDGICTMDECLQTISQATAGTRPLAAKAALKPGTAAAASPLEMHMNPWQKVVAYFSGNPEARAAANLSEAELAQAQASTQSVDPAITQALSADKARFEELEARVANSEAVALNTLAESFADNVIKVEKKADPASRPTIIGMFKMAAIQDGGGLKAKFENGVLVEGSNLKMIRDDYAARKAVEGHGVRVADRKQGDDAKPAQMGAIVRSAVAATNRQGAR